VIGEAKVPIVGIDTYDLFPGGHFLVHHVDVTVDDDPVRAIEVIGEREGNGGFLARSFDSEGNAELMHLTIDNDRCSTSPAAPTSRPPRNPPTRRPHVCAPPSPSQTIGRR
jgi:hypothetical protein